MRKVWDEYINQNMNVIGNLQEIIPAKKKEGVRIHASGACGWGEQWIVQFIIKLTCLEHSGSFLWPGCELWPHLPSVDCAPVCWPSCPGLYSKSPESEFDLYKCISVHV